MLPPTDCRCLTFSFIADTVHFTNVCIIMPPPVGKGAISVAVVWIWILEWRFHALDSHAIFKIKRSKVRVTRPINADTHRAPYLPNGNAYELQTWYTDGGRRPASATSAMVKVARSCGQSEPCWPNAVPVSLEASGGIPCRPIPVATLVIM